MERKKYRKDGYVLKAQGKMKDLNVNISIITLNPNRINAPIRGQRL